MKKNIPLLLYDQLWLVADFQSFLISRLDESRKENTQNPIYLELDINIDVWGDPETPPQENLSNSVFGKLLRQVRTERNKSSANDKQVGCIIFDLDNTVKYIQPEDEQEIMPEIIASGHNQMWDNLNESCEYSNGESKEYVQHAEEVALFSLIGDGSNYHKKQNNKYRILFTTLAPCWHCARLIARGEIDCVMFIDKHTYKFDGTDAYVSAEPNADRIQSSPATFLQKMNIDLIHLKLQ